MPVFNIKGKVFTTAAVDIIDHNPSSTTSKSAFHGTGIFIFQHPMKDNIGIRRDELILPIHLPKSKKVTELPAADMNMKPAYIKTKLEPLILPDDITNILNHDFLFMSEIVMTNSDDDHDDLSPCNHEEADTMIFVHIKSAAEKGDADMELTEAFVVVMYDRTTTTFDINESRLELVARKQDSMTPFHPLELHCLSIPNELHTKVAMYRDRQ
ncbi:Hypothetical predicted protein [Mytilus galloprovincialis]|uniref:Uncharacterized protein n=1 Tax=Mytilus galloprovincialis TaxID=29158 RepID=A0A8B6FQV7_MYTGA|nr:Hypothetical predicted protein [Mytilus galloprovincialis]